MTGSNIGTLEGVDDRKIAGTGAEGLDIFKAIGFRKWEVEKCVGFKDSTGVGASLGHIVSFTVGIPVGAIDGPEGLIEGIDVGIAEGFSFGCKEGRLNGCFDGNNIGCTDGPFTGSEVGLHEGKR
jgi:hypothetical protein